MRIWLSKIVVLVATAVVMGCGGSEGSDRPEDCTDDQYFDEGSSQCRSCPATIEPECMTGCGLDVVEDNRGCPVLRCDPGCEGCEEGQTWNREEESCEPQ